METAVAKIASKLGKLAAKLSKFKIVEKIGKGISTAGGKVKEGIGKLKNVIKPTQKLRVLLKVNSKLREKILWGTNTTGNKVIGGHFRGLIKHPNFSVEFIAKSTINPNCEVYKFIKGLSGNRVSKIKRSTFFPSGWSKGDIIKAIEKVANNPATTRIDNLNPAKSFLRGKVKGTIIEVIVDNGKITSGYPL